MSSHEGLAYVVTIVYHASMEEVVQEIKGCNVTDMALRRALKMKRSCLFHVKYSCFRDVDPF